MVERASLAASFLWLNKWKAIVSIVLGYGVGVARAKWPFLPWDEAIIPLLLTLGVIGVTPKKP